MNFMNGQIFLASKSIANGRFLGQNFIEISYCDLFHVHCAVHVFELQNKLSYVRYSTFISRILIRIYIQILLPSLFLFISYQDLQFEFGHYFRTHL